MTPEVVSSCSAKGYKDRKVIKTNAMSGGENRRSRIPLALACLAVSMAVLVAGLWPFKFFPRNEVSWLGTPGGLRFGRLGIARTETPVFGPGRPLMPGGAVTIEMAVRPESEAGGTVAQLLSLWDGRERILFSVGQWKSHLILRTYKAGNGRRLYLERGVLNVLRPGAVTFLTITSDDNVTVVYLDGVAVKEFRSFPLVPGDPGSAGILVLGNSPTGDAQWQGDFLFLAFHDRVLSPGETAAGFPERSGSLDPNSPPRVMPALSYPFDDREGHRARNPGDPRYDISIPQRFRVPEKTVLSFSSGNPVLSRSFASDLAINILGFIPFGLCFEAWLRVRRRWTSRASVLGAALLGASVSLVIELVQVYIPTRHSSLPDLVCNAFGAALGGYLLTRFRHMGPVAREVGAGPPSV